MLNEAITAPKAEAQSEAIAQADAYLSNAGLPTYTDLLAAVESLALECAA